MLNRRCLQPVVALGAAALLPAASPPQDALAELQALRAADLRIHRIAHRLITANAPLCPRQGRATGILLHSLKEYAESYRPAARRAFGLGEGIAVEGVIPGSAADRAGVEAGDVLKAVAGTPLQGDDAKAVDRAAALLEDGPAEPLEVTVERGGAGQRRLLHPAPACAVRVELAVAEGSARTDGRTLQVMSDLPNLVADDGLLATGIAHELAHVILDHPRRLDAAGVRRGRGAGRGRSGALWRRTEMEADRLAPYLMANAGYDPRGAVEYWRRYGREFDPGDGANSTHPGWRRRLAAIEAEIPAVEADRGRPRAPDWIESRTEPLSD